MWHLKKSQQATLKSQNVCSYQSLQNNYFTVQVVSLACKYTFSFFEKLWTFWSSEKQDCTVQLHFPKAAHQQFPTHWHCYKSACAVAAVMIDDMQRPNLLQRGCKTNHRGTTHFSLYLVPHLNPYAGDPECVQPIFLFWHISQFFLCRNILPLKDNISSNSLQ